MRKSADGLVPARGFLKAGLAPRPVFNDGSYPEPLEIVVDDKGTRKAVQSLRTPVSTYERRVRYCVLEFEKLLDSSSIDSTGWDQIARTVQRNYQLFDGFVILHGTDSLAYTSSALSFMFHNLGKPVVLTGSQAPMMNLQTDAQDNLLNSLIIAGHFMIPEVCLFFNFKLFRGNRATKVSAEDFDAFSSPNLPPLATISSTRTNVLWHRVHRSTDLSPFSIQTNLDTAHVACLRVFPGITPAMVDAVLHLDGLKGLVLETFGAGNTPGGPDSAMTRCLADAVKRGIVIVNVTQCLSGSVSALYAPGAFLGRAGVVFGQDLTSEAALTKLAYLLSLPGATPEEVSRRMSLSLRGELTETTRTHFEHPSRSGFLTPELSSLTALGYAIQKGDLQETRDIIRGEPRWLLNDVDYQMNSPTVSTFPSSQRSCTYLYPSLWFGRALRARPALYCSCIAQEPVSDSDARSLQHMGKCSEEADDAHMAVIDKDDRGRRQQRRQNHTGGGGCTTAYLSACFPRCMQEQKRVWNMFHAYNDVQLRCRMLTREHSTLQRPAPTSRFCATS